MFDDFQRKDSFSTKTIAADIFQSVTLLAVVIEPDGRTVSINPFGCELLECRKEDIIGKVWFDTFLPDEVKKDTKEYISSLFKPHNPFPPHLNFVKTASGKILTIEWHNIVIRDKDNAVKFIAGLGSDLTGKLKAASDEFYLPYRFFIENLPDGVYIVNPDSRLKYVNKIFAQMLGYDSPDELVGTNIFDLIHEEARDFVREQIQERRTEQQNKVQYKIRLFRKDGSLLLAEIIGGIINANGEKIFLGIVRNIAERNRFSEQLQRIEKIQLSEKLIEAVAHDFNNLLGAILGHASLLVKTVPENEPYFKKIETIFRTSQKAADLLDRIVKVVRASDEYFKQVDVNAVTKETIATIEDILPKNIEVRFCCYEEPLPIWGDELQLNRVILNIIINAVEAMPHGGIIEIKTTRISNKETNLRDFPELSDGTYANIEIGDTGTGMTDEVKQNLFVPFFTTKGTEGSGLGLASSYGIIRAHGGEIFVRSAPNVGSVFSIYIPLYFIDTADEKQKESETHCVSIPKNGAGILIVDDEESIRSLIEITAKDANYRTFIAQNAKEAKNLLTRYNDQIQLSIIDVRLGNEKGTAVAEQLKKIKPSLKVLFISGYNAKSETDLNTKKRKNYLFLQKPFTVDTLLEAIKTALGVGE